MKRFFVNNWRGLFHIVGIVECFFIFWISGLIQFAPDHLANKLLVLVVAFFSTEIALKVVGFKKLMDKEKEKIIQEDKEKLE